MKKAVVWTFVVTIFFTIFAHFVGIRSSLLYLFIPFVVFIRWIPGIVALIFSKKEKIKLPLFKESNRYLYIAFVLPILIGIFSILISIPYGGNFDLTYFGGIKLQLNYYLIICVFFFLIFGSLFGTFFTFGEEMMWRGYLFQKLSHLGFWRSSLITGLIWGLWNSPYVILYGNRVIENHYLMALWVVLNCLMLSPILCYFRTLGKSILVPSLFRGIYLFVEALPLFFFKEPKYFLIGLTSLAILLVINLILYFRTRRSFI